MHFTVKVLRKYLKKAKYENEKIQTEGRSQNPLPKYSHCQTWSSGRPGSLLFREPATTRTDLMARRPQS